MPAHLSSSKSAARNAATTLLNVFNLRRSTTLLTVLLASTLTAATALGYWSAPGTGTAAGGTGNLNAPTAVTASAPAGSTTVAVSWTASSSTGATAPEGYYVTRTRTSDSTTSPACGSSPSSLVTGTSCNDTGVGSGAYTYVVVAKLGGWTAPSAASASVEVVSDTTAPVVTLDKVNGSSATFPMSRNTAVTSVGGSCGTLAGDLSAVSVAVTGASTQNATATCTAGSWQLTLSSPLSADGSYAVQASQSDSVGNTGNTGAKSIRIDTGAPTVTLTRVNAAAVSFPHRRATDVTSVGGSCTSAVGDSITISVTTTGQASSSVTAACASNAWQAALSLTAAGTYSVSASQGDDAGNTGTSGARAITLDKTAPAVTLTKVNASAATFPLTTSSVVTSVGGECSSATGDVATVNVSVTGQSTQSASASCSGLTWQATLTTSLSADGTYAITATQADDVANTGSSGAKSVTVDRTGPTVTAAIANTITTTGGYLKQGGTYFVYANATDAVAGVNAGSLTASIANVGTASSTTLSSAGGPFVVRNDDGTTTSYTYRSAQQTATAALTAGAKAFSVSASDSLGNAGTSSGATVLVDNAGPTVSTVSSANVAGGTQGRAEAGDSVTLTFGEKMAAPVVTTSNVTMVVANPNGAPNVVTMPGLFNASWNLGTESQYAQKSSSIAFNGSTLAREATLTNIRLTLATCSGDCARLLTMATATTFTFAAPATGLTDLAGNAATGTPANQTLRFF